jgi:hypothetical protein
MVNDQKVTLPGSPWKWVAIVPVISFFAVVIWLSWCDSHAAYESPYLLAILTEVSRPG